MVMALFGHRQRNRAREADASGAVHDDANGEPQRDHSAGGLLRETRESFRWELADVAAALRIRPEYLELLEQNSFAGLPGRTYASGFLRAYAEYLGLDSDEVMRRFRKAENGVVGKSELAFPVPLTERGIPGGGIFLIALLLGVIAYGLYHFADTSGTKPAEQAIAPPPARLLPPPPAPQQLAGAEPGKPADAPLTSQQQTPAPPTNTMPAVATQTLSTSSGPTAPIAGSPGMSTVAILAPSSAPAPSGASDSTSAAADADAAKPAAHSFGDATPGRIVIRATGKTWVVVKDGEKPILNRLFDKGDSYNAPDRKGLVMRTGSVGAIEVVIDGRTLPAFGPVGQVKTVQLDADKLAAVTPPG
jgi:cytoskeleton protein RodZ